MIDDFEYAGRLGKSFAPPIPGLSPLEYRADAFRKTTRMQELGIAHCPAVRWPYQSIDAQAKMHYMPDFRA